MQHRDAMPSTPPRRPSSLQAHGAWATPARALAAFALVACTGAGAQALDSGVTTEISAGPVYRKLVERSSAGGTLLTEQGWLAQVRGSAVKVLPSGAAVAGALSLAGAPIDYNGQTQAGAPLSTTTRQIEVAADLLWRPLAPRAWGQAWLTAQWLLNRREIEGTASAGGLDERSRAVLLGARWVSPVFAPGAGWQAWLVADARVSLHHQLEVDYRGLLDASSLAGARKHEWALRLAGRRAESPWTWEVEAARLTQAASDEVPVYRAGALFGTVRQPALTIEDLALRVSRRF